MVLKETKLTKETLIPISIMGAILLSAIGGTWWFSGLMKAIDQSIQMVGRDVRDLQSSIRLLERDVGNGLSVTEMKMWVEILRAKNPSLVIPDIR